MTDKLIEALERIAAMDPEVHLPGMASRIAHDALAHPTVEARVTALEARIEKLEIALKWHGIRSI